MDLDKTFELATNLDRAAIDLRSLRYLKTPTPHSGAEHRRDRDDSSDEVASRVRAHVQVIRLKRYLIVAQMRKNPDNRKRPTY